MQLRDVLFYKYRFGFFDGFRARYQSSANAKLYFLLSRFPGCCPRTCSSLSPHASRAAAAATRQRPRNRLFSSAAEEEEEEAEAEEAVAESG
jgi:hypothetical protein